MTAMPGIVKSDTIHNFVSSSEVAICRIFQLSGAATWANVVSIK
jgi:hypothetical protein